MTNPDNGRYSYLRMLREIVPSESLQGFMKAAHEAAFDDGFDGFKSGTKPFIFPAESLRVTLFERRAKAGEYISQLLNLENYLTRPKLVYTERVHTRPGGPVKPVKKSRNNPLPSAIKELENGHVNNNGVLYVQADQIVSRTLQDYGHHGTQLALRIADSEAANVLDAQSELIADAARRIMAGQALPKPAEPDDPRLIPFMWAQFHDNAAREEYLDLLHPELPVYEIGCMAVEADHRHRT